MKDRPNFEFVYNLISLEYWMDKNWEMESTLVHGVAEYSAADESGYNGVDPLVMVDGTYISIANGRHGYAGPVETEDIFLKESECAVILSGRKPVILRAEFSDGIESASDQVCGIDNIEGKKDLEFGRGEK